MSPIELLKSGIQNGDWQDVCSAYETLTGQSLKPPVQALAAKELASVLRGTLHMAVDATFDEWVGGKAPKAKPTPKAKTQTSVIVVPTAEEAEAILDAEEPGRIEMLPEDGLGITEEDGDRVKPEDIESEGPTERIKNAGMSAKPNCYNEPMKFVSAEADPREIARNQRKAEAAAKRKQIRPEPVKYQVECSKCGRTFESTTPPSKQIGQKCARCIRSMEKPER